jgi:hypothetical protein
LHKEPGIRWHLSVLPTTLARQFLPVLTTLLRSELTLSQNERQLLRSQASRKKKRCPYISSNYKKLYRGALHLSGGVMEAGATSSTSSYSNQTGS